MFEKIKPYLEKAKEFLKKISKKVYIAVGVLLVLAVILVIWLNNRPYTVLFTELSSTEMSSILSYLEDSGVTDYKVQNNDTILVKDNQEDSLRAKLVMEGYGQSGFAFTYSESGGVLSTESERTEAALRDLQDRLSATVRCFDGIKNAIVTINSGEDRSYVLDSNNVINATASVVVEMSSGAKLTTEQAAAIRNLIAHSVKGLEIDAVSISDTLGNTYSTGDAATADDASALKLQLEEEQENKIRTNVLQALIPFFGADNVKVSVNCIVDVSQTVENNYDVYLPEYAEDGSTGGQGIVGSRIYNWIIVRDGDETAGGVVGTSTNSDFPEYVEDLPELNGDETEVDLSGQVDYVHSTSEKQIIRTAGYLADCMISVSINSTTAGVVDISEISQHVARAAGITGVYDDTTGEEYLRDKISVISMPFYEPDTAPIISPESPVELWMIIAAGGGLLLFLILLVLILLIRRKRKKKKKAEQQRDMESYLAAAMAARVPGAEDGADVMSMQSEKSVELRQDIRKFAEDNPEIAAQMVKVWLRGDDSNG